MQPKPLMEAPLISPTQFVIEDWIDYNGHLNMAFYNVIFDRAVDHFYDLLGVGSIYARNGAGSCFTIEVHVHYLKKCLERRIRLHLQLLDYDKSACIFSTDVSQDSRLLGGNIRATRPSCGYDHAQIGRVPEHVLDSLGKWRHPPKTRYSAAGRAQIGIKRMNSRPVWTKA